MADVPPGVVTVTSTVPVPAGLSAVIEVALTTVKFVAGVVPKSTAVAPVKPVPVIVTNVPPAAGPIRAQARDRRRVREHVGGRGRRRAARGGHGHVHGAGARRALGRINVVLSTKSLVAGVVPKSTAVAPVKPVPAIVTNVPPAAGPKVGLKPVTVVGVIRSSSSSSRGRQRRRRREPSARRCSFRTKGRGCRTNGDICGSLCSG